MARLKIGVIGAGMVGVTAASFLQRDGHDVFLIDAAEPGSGASFGNAGCFNGSSVVPMSLPGTLKKVPGWLADPLGPLSLRWTYLPALAPWLIRYIRAGRRDRVEATARALRSLIEPSLETLAPLLRDAGAIDLVHQLGHLFLYRTEAQLQGERLAWDLRRASGVEWEEFSQEELRQVEPTVARDFVKGILVRENGHTSNPQRLVQSLAAAIVRNGGAIHRARARSFVLDGDRLRAIRTEAGDFPADRAVLAAGAHSKVLAAQLGDRIPLETERGYHLMIRDPEVMPRIPTYDAGGKFVATPMETGLRFAGTVELAGLTAAPDWRRAQMLLEQGRKLLPGLAPHYSEDRITMWMGHRPSLPDSKPAIGRSRKSGDVLYAFGHGHIGMVAAPMTGKLVAQLIDRGPTAIDAAPFRPDRF